MTPPPSPTSRLVDAGWTQDGSNWTHPTIGGPHSLPVALMLSDLPRVRHEAEIAPINHRGQTNRPPSKARLVMGLTADENLTIPEAAQRLGITVKAARSYAEKQRRKAREASK